MLVKLSASAHLLVGISAPSPNRAPLVGALLIELACLAVGLAVLAWLAYLADPVAVEETGLLMGVTLVAAAA